MGKIHDALQRAEQERARAGAAASTAAAHLELEPRMLTGPRVRGSERAERLRDARRSRFMLADAASNVTEEYRTLRARIQSIRRTQPLRSIMITSALPGEGKTTTAVNLALSFGLELEGATCLVDADLRTPAVHHAIFESPEAGLAELLELDVKLEDALVHVPDTRLSVLTVRALPTHPSELLASRRMAELMQELQSRFDTVLIDSPPILGLPDATTLVDLCDAVLLVIGSGTASRADVDAALAQIDASKALGCVFNRSKEAPTAYGTYGRGKD